MKEMISGPRVEPWGPPLLRKASLPQSKMQKIQTTMQNFQMQMNIWMNVEPLSKTSDT